MLEIGIPVYKAENTLWKLFDSLMAQTSEDFQVCLSIDGDGIDYSNIINHYQNRGLKIRVIASTENHGPGVARQRILDTTEADYLMYVDADDLLMPRAVQVLYEGAKKEQYDIVRSAFIREFIDRDDQYLPCDIDTVTWFHGKIYRVAYLKEKNIHFHPDLRADEDAFFNLLAWNCASKRGEVTEATYVWRYNKNSITRIDNNKKDYFLRTYMYYITSQVEGLKELYRIMGQTNDQLTAQTLINIYDYYMQARYYQVDESNMDKLISTLKEFDWLSEFLKNGTNWAYIVQNCKMGDIYNDEIVVFYNEPINLWIARLLKSDD